MVRSSLSVLLGLAVLALPLSASAKTPPYIEVNLAKYTKNVGVNQMDDACYGCPIKISFPETNPEKDGYRLEFKGSTPEVGCAVVGASSSKGVSSILVDANVDTDSGDTCDVHVTHPNGKKSVVSIEETGT